MDLACKTFLGTSLFAFTCEFGWRAFRDGQHPDAAGMVSSYNVFRFLQLAMMFAAFVYLLRRLQS